LTSLAGSAISKFNSRLSLSAIVVAAPVSQKTVSARVNDNLKVSFPIRWFRRIRRRLPCAAWTANRATHSQFGSTILVPRDAFFMLKLVISTGIASSNERGR
jgi:hypothetical protein